MKIHYDSFKNGKHMTEKAKSHIAYNVSLPHCKF